MGGLAALTLGVPVAGVPAGGASTMTSVVSMSSLRLTCSVWVQAHLHVCGLVADASKGREQACVLRSILRQGGWGLGGGGEGAGEAACQPASAPLPRSKDTVEKTSLRGQQRSKPQRRRR